MATPTKRKAAVAAIGAITEDLQNEEEERATSHQATTGNQRPRDNDKMRRRQMHSTKNTHGPGRRLKDGKAMPQESKGQTHEEESAGVLMLHSLYAISEGDVSFEGMKSALGTRLDEAQ